MLGPKLEDGKSMKIIQTCVGSNMSLCQCQNLQKTAVMSSPNMFFSAQHSVFGTSRPGPLMSTHQKSTSSWCFMPQYTPVKRNILHLWISKCQSYTDSRFAEFLQALLASIHTGLIPHLCHLLFLPRVVHLAHFPATAVSLRFRKKCR